MKRFVKKLLNQLFTGLLKDYKDQDVSIKNWQGEIEQENLELDSDVLSNYSVDLGFPLRIERGTIKKLYLHLPWKNLNNEDIIIRIENINIIAVIDILSTDSYQKLSKQLSQRKTLNKIEAKIIKSFKKKSRKATRLLF